jgi:tRNA nucleotidyltransferase/poly(A) polymerase
MLDEAAASAHLALMSYLSGVTKRLGVGEHVYVVGGAVRNFVLNVPIKDIDIVIDSVALGGRDSEWLAKQLQKEIPTATNLTTNQYGVAILTVKGDWELEGYQLKGEVIEIANAREESYGAGGKGYKPSEVKASTIKADVYRREFTFNTLMWRLSDLASGPEKAEIVDITGCGLRDLKAGVTRCPSDPDKTFGDDPTRMLRAIKFLVKYGFKVEGEVADAIRRNARKMLNAPHEAISTLLINTILHEPTATVALKEMARLGLLAVVAEMLETNKEFAATLANWANNKKVAFLFDLLDHGLPLATPLDFLKPDEQKRLRQVAATLPSGEAEELLAALKQPSRALGDKSFIPKLAAQFGVPTSQMKDFAPKVGAAVRAALLDDPGLLRRPDKLRDVATAAVPKTESVLGEVAAPKVQLLVVLHRMREEGLSLYDAINNVFGVTGGLGGDSPEADAVVRKIRRDLKVPKSWSETDVRLGPGGLLLKKTESVTEASSKCPMSGWLIEDLKSVKEILHGDFETGSPEYRAAEEFRAKWEGGTPFKVTCDCGKTVSTVLRGNNWRVATHALPKTEDVEEEVEYRGRTFPGYNKPIASDRPEKKKMVLAKKGDEVKLIHFGQKGYKHNYSAAAKKNYLARSAGIRKKDGSLTKDDKFSANYWARKVLWPKGKKSEDVQSRMEALLSEGADALLAASRKLAGQHLNCRLFVQLLLKTPALEKLPVVKAMKVGDVLQWGASPARHWAVYLGDDYVLEVPEWGADPRVTDLKDVEREYGEPIIRRAD